MSILIVAVLFGLIFSSFATQNTIGVNIQFANYLITLPLYLIVLGSLLLGLLISWVINLIDNLSSAFTLQSKEHQIRSTQHEVEVLHDKIHQLEVENARLRGESDEIILEEPAPPHKPNLIARLGHTLFPTRKRYA